MGMDSNYRGIDGNCKEIDLIWGSHPPLRNIKRERGNALSTELVYSSMMEMRSLVDIYRTIKLFYGLIWPYSNGSIFPHVHY